MVTEEPMEQRHNIVEYHPDEYTPLKPEEADETELAKLLLETNGFSSFLFREERYESEKENGEDDDITVQRSNRRMECERRRLRTSLRASRFHRGKSFTRQLSSDEEDDHQPNYVSNGNKRVRISEL